MTLNKQIEILKEKYKNKDVINNNEELASLTNELVQETTKQSFKDMGVSNNTLETLTKVINDSNNCTGDCAKNKKQNTDLRMKQLEEIKKKIGRGEIDLSAEYQRNRFMNIN